MTLALLRKPGRPRNPETKQACEMNDAGHTVKEIAEAIGRPLATTYSLLSNHGRKANKAPRRGRSVSPVKGWRPTNWWKAASRIERVEFIREHPGRRHRLKVIDCGHCERPMFPRTEKGPRCPGKPEFRPPVCGGRLDGRSVCPACWKRARGESGA
jgi:hypothetical protein